MQVSFLIVMMLLFWPVSSHAKTEKELPVHNIIYGSTYEVTDRIKAIIEEDQLLDVKRLCQVHTTKPYDYVGTFLMLLMLIFPCFCSVQSKKGLLAYDTIYGSTAEVAYWIKALIGEDQQLDVKRLCQVLTVEPYDYVMIGSYTRWEKPDKPTYKFVESYQDDLAQKEVAYFLICGETDETMILKYSGKPPHIASGRNFLLDIQDKFPAIKPVTTGGFGGRHATPTLNTKDTFFMWILNKMAKEKLAWEGIDIWESLIPERVEAFANEIREKILGLPPGLDIEKYRSYWKSLQPASLTDKSKVKFTPKPYNEHQSTDTIFFTRSRIKGNLDDAISLLKSWEKQAGADLREQKKTFYNIYYHAIKKYNGKELTTHVVASTLPEDPGNVHVSFRNFDNPNKRKGVEEDIGKAEAILWADGRKVKGE
jgi:menaquinone-dependent protoporphyrinogen IX oxidase